MAYHASSHTNLRPAAPVIGAGDPSIFDVGPAPEEKPSEFGPATADAVIALEAQASALAYQATQLQEIATEIEWAGGNTGDVSAIRSDAAGLREIAATVQQALQRAARDSHGQPKLPAAMVAKLQTQLSTAMAAGTSEAKQAEASHVIDAVAAVVKKAVAAAADDARHQKAEEARKKEEKAAEERASARRKVVVVAAPTMIWPDLSETISFSGTSFWRGPAEGLFGDLGSAPGIHLPPIRPSFLDTGTQLWDGIHLSAQQLGDFTVDVGHSIGVGMDSLIASDPVQGAIAGLKNARASVATAVEERYTAAANHVKAAVNTTRDAVVDTTKTTMLVIENGVASSVEVMGTIGEGAINAAVAVGDAVMNPVATARAVGDKVAEAAGNLKQAAAETAASGKANLVKAAQWMGLMSKPAVPVAEAAKPTALAPTNPQALAGALLGIHLPSITLAPGNPAALGLLDSQSLPQNQKAIAAAGITPHRAILN